MEYKKQYMRKGSVSNNIFIPIKKELINNTEYVIFNNGARCTMETFKQDFELYNMNENNMNENNMNENNMNENNTFYDNDEQPINPDDFFAPKVDETLIDTVESIVNNPNQHIGRQRPESRDLNNSYSQQNQQTSAYVLSNDRPPVKNYDLDNRLNLNSQQHNVQQHNVQTNRLPEHDIFDRVKANSDLEITIPFMLVIPKSQKIDTMDDMFESSFVDYLAEKYINTVVVENLDLLKKLIRDGIQEWVEISLASKKRKAVVKSEPFDIKKSKEVEVKEVEVKEVEVKEVDTEEVEVEEVEVKEVDTEEVDTEEVDTKEVVTEEDKEVDKEE